MVSHDFMVSDSLDLSASEVSHSLFERSLGTVTVLHRRCKLAEYSSQSNGLPVNTNGNQGACDKRIELHPSTLIPRLFPAFHRLQYGKDTRY